MRRIESRAGFTLIELMIVVAIIGILASIAIPNFVRFQMRAKAGEGKLNLTAIRSSQAAYFSEYGSYIDMGPEPSTSGPDGAIGPVKRRWARCPGALTMSSPGHCIVGFFPEGPTYFDYALASNGPGNSNLGPGSIATEFFADAIADIDGNGDVNSYGLRITESGAEDGTGFTVGAGPGGCTEVLDEYGNDSLYGLVGPCGVGMGQTIF